MRHKVLPHLWRPEAILRQKIDETETGQNGKRREKEGGLTGMVLAWSEWMAMAGNGERTTARYAPAMVSDGEEEGARGLPSATLGRLFRADDEGAEGNPFPG